MTGQLWSMLAANMAGLCRERSAAAQRKVGLAPTQDRGLVDVWVLGQERLASSEQVRREIALLRGMAQEAGMVELGHGISSDGSLWVWLGRARLARCATEAGERFQQAMLLQAVGEVVELAHQGSLAQRDG
jgi:hypothetical protein